MWALDEVAPSLADAIAGRGRGPEFELVNRLLVVRSADPAAHVVVADDAVLTAGTIARLAGAGDGAEDWRRWVAEPS